MKPNHRKFRIIFNISGEIAEFYRWAEHEWAAYVQAMRACAFIYGFSRPKMRGYRYEVQEVKHEQRH